MLRIGAASAALVLQFLTFQFLTLCSTGSGAQAAEIITAARFSAPTTRYQHGILGDAVEWGQLEIDTIGVDPDRMATLSVKRDNTYVFRLPLDHVFEDTAPRLLDVTGDGHPEVIVVETDVQKGAALAVYDSTGKLAETPHIGQRNRWLAPIGAADFDGDGHIEVAYVDRPHLAKVLQVWRYRNRKLTKIASLAGVTNHRIGEVDITSGVRLCDGQPEMVLAGADWRRVLVVGFQAGKLVSRDAGPFAGGRSIRKVLSCR